MERGNVSSSLSTGETTWFGTQHMANVMNFFSFLLVNQIINKKSLMLINFIKHLLTCKMKLSPARTWEHLLERANVALIVSDSIYSNISCDGLSPSILPLTGTKLKTTEGGDGEDGDCYRYFSIDFLRGILWFIFQPHFRHQDRRFVFSGICLANRYFSRYAKAKHVSKVSLCVIHNCVLRSKNMMSED